MGVSSRKAYLAGRLKLSSTTLKTHISLAAVGGVIYGHPNEPAAAGDDRSVVVKRPKRQTIVTKRVLVPTMPYDHFYTYPEPTPKRLTFCEGNVSGGA
jgi:hypothetical protein